ncbi:PfkB family carbohydrate kinase, partial [Aeromonas salmonicida]
MVVNRGPGPSLIVQDERCNEVPAVSLEQTQVIDTTAAGDSFSAG